MTESNKSAASGMGCAAIAVVFVVAVVLFVLMSIAARLDRIDKVLHLNKPCTRSIPGFRLTSFARNRMGTV